MLKYFMYSALFRMFSPSIALKKLNATNFDIYQYSKFFWGFKPLIPTRINSHGDNEQGGISCLH